MNFEIRGIHYEVSDKTREQIEKKFKRLATAEDTLTFLEITVGQTACTLLRATLHSNGVAMLISRPQTEISMTPSTS